MCQNHNQDPTWKICLFTFTSAVEWQTEQSTEPDKHGEALHYTSQGRLRSKHLCNKTVSERWGFLSVHYEHIRHDILNMPVLCSMKSTRWRCSAKHSYYYYGLLCWAVLIHCHLLARRQLYSSSIRNILYIFFSQWALITLMHLSFFSSFVSTSVFFCKHQ